MKKPTLIPILAGLLALAGCDMTTVPSEDSSPSLSSSSAEGTPSSSESESEPLKSLSFKEDTLEIDAGTSLLLEWTGENLSSAPSFSSSDETIASVDEEGTLTAHKAGSVTITISADGLSDTLLVSVSEAPAVEIKNLSEFAAGVGYTITTDVLALHSEEEVLWTSSDPEVATVSGEGVVSCLKEGEVTITASLEEASDSILIHVRPLTDWSLLPHKEVEIDGTKGIALCYDVGMQPGLEALEEVIVPPEKDGLPVIRCGDIYGDTPFFYLQSLKTLAFPESVTVLKESLFGYVGVERLYVPNTVTTIEKRVFCNCKNLKELYIPDSVTSLAEDTFSDCPSLKSLRLPAGLGIVPSYSGTGLEAIAVEEGIEEIPDYAFSDTAYLKTLTLPSTLKKIGFRILEHSSLASLDLPDGVEELSDQAFNVASLTKIFLPASVATVGRMAFCNLPDEFELYCEAESKPEGWDEEFMYKNELGGYEWKIHWGAKRGDLA